MFRIPISNIKINDRYRFESLDIRAVGDKYEYRVKADSADEAFEKLVRYFYDKNGGPLDIESKHFVSHIPGRDVFRSSDNMPNWFHRLISGYGTKEDYQKLEDYCKSRKIDIKY